MSMNQKTSVIHRKGAKSAKDAKNDLPEVSGDFLIRPWDELEKFHKFLFPLRSLYLCAFAVRISG